MFRVASLRDSATSKNDRLLAFRVKRIFKGIWVLEAEKEKPGGRAAAKCLENAQKRVFFGVSTSKWGKCITRRDKCSQCGFLIFGSSPREIEERRITLKGFPGTV